MSSSRVPVRSPWLGLLALILVAVLAGAGCGGDDDEASPGDGPSTGGSTETSAGGLSGDLTILAAASLTESFTELGEAFEAAHPGVTVTFSFDASSSLAVQANSGAPADLFASADEANMGKVTDAGNAVGPKTFARNQLAMLVGKGNPQNIEALGDYDRSDVIFVLCAPEAPCGRYGQQALDNAGVTARPKSYEINVKGVVTKVATGEADAGIVYVTDAAAAAESTDRVPIAGEHNVTGAYPITVLEQSGQPDLAAAFMDFVLSAEGQHILSGHGFLSP